MALKNNFLTKAKKEKNDEFYTQMHDVSNECSKFTEYFNGKIIYCPCDNYMSNFTKYFVCNFERLNLKGLYYSTNENGLIYFDGNKFTNIDEFKKIDITTSDFDKILDMVDMVVTNPPFSLFVKFITKIIEQKKEFLVIGPQNAISGKKVFSYLINNEMSVDYGFKGLVAYFDVPAYYEDFSTGGAHKEGQIRVSGVVWYTNLNFKQEKPFLELTSKYYDENGNPNTEKYELFDNFKEISGLDEDCINIDKVKDIPSDYYGYMGVPISFFEKYNPNQFEIIQLDHYGPLGNLDNVVNGAQKYRRIYIRRKVSDKHID